MYYNLETILYHGTVSTIKQVDVELGRGIQYFIGKQEVADKLIVDMKMINWR